MRKIIPPISNNPPTTIKTTAQIGKAEVVFELGFGGTEIRVRFELKPEVAFQVI
jgi:hypothetical protein